MNETEAEALVELILRYARAHDFAALLRIALDPQTEPALDLLPQKATGTARVQLRGALKWRERQYERNAERMDEVRQALDGYDITLARGILRRIEGDLVHDDDRERYNSLLLEVEAKAIEAERLAEVANDIAPPDPPRKKRRWFKR